MVFIWFWSNKEKKKKNKNPSMNHVSGKEPCIASFVFFFLNTHFLLFLSVCMCVWVCRHQYPGRPEALGLAVVEVAGSCKLDVWCWEWTEGSASAVCTLNSGVSLPPGPTALASYTEALATLMSSDDLSPTSAGGPLWDTWGPAPMKCLLSKAALRSEAEGQLPGGDLVQSFICR